MLFVLKLFPWPIKYLHSWQEATATICHAMWPCISFFPLLLSLQLLPLLSKQDGWHMAWMPWGKYQVPPSAKSQAWHSPVCSDHREHSSACVAGIVASPEMKNHGPWSLRSSNLLKTVSDGRWVTSGHRSPYTHPSHPRHSVPMFLTELQEKALASAHGRQEGSEDDTCCVFEGGPTVTGCWRPCEWRQLEWPSWAKSMAEKSHCILGIPVRKRELEAVSE